MPKEGIKFSNEELSNSSRVSSPEERVALEKLYDSNRACQPKFIAWARDYAPAGEALVFEWSENNIEIHRQLFTGLITYGQAIQMTQRNIWSLFGSMDQLSKTMDQAKKEEGRALFQFAVEAALSNPALAPQPSYSVPAPTFGPQNTLVFRCGSIGKNANFATGNCM